MSLFHYGKKKKKLSLIAPSTFGRCNNVSVAIYKMKTIKKLITSYILFETIYIRNRARTATKNLRVGTRYKRKIMTHTLTRIYTRKYNLANKGPKYVCVYRVFCKL